MPELLDRWRAAARGAGATDETAVTRAGTDLLSRWAEPHRRYHTLDHLTEVLSVVDDHARFPPDPDLVRLAAWYHDAIYDPRAGTARNERASAALAGELLTRLRLPAASVAEVERLVLLTASHRSEPDDRNGALLCDADLAVLAAPPDRYDRYAAAIRREYGHVPDPEFTVGRAAVLRQLLDLPTLYRVPALADRWAGPARANLTRELADLDRRAAVTRPAYDTPATHETRAAAENRAVYERRPVQERSRSRYENRPVHENRSGLDG